MERPTDPTQSRNTALLDGSNLTPGLLTRIGAGATVEIAADAVRRMAVNQAAAERVSRQRPVYGRTTGVGAARGQPGGTGIDLWRSHAAGWGPRYAVPVVRAALAVRANQLAVGRSGASPRLALALAEAACGPAGRLPVVHRHGGLGTGDLTALAEVGLTLAGERPARDGASIRLLQPTHGDGLALLSSNAFTVAAAALAGAEARELAGAASVVAALSWAALRGNAEPVGPALEWMTQLAGAVEVAQTVSALLPPAAPGAGRPIQDFYGLRAWPQAHGPLLDAVDRLAGLLTTMVNLGSENPAFGDERVSHHGGFHTAYLAGAVESVLAAAARSGALVQSRVSHLLTDRDSGLPLFLGDRAGASGALIGEYVGASALAVIRASVVAPQSVVLSGGVEDDAPLTPLLVERLGEVVQAYRRLLAVELLCAVRALRLRGGPLDGPLGEVLSACELPSGVVDRDLSPDLDRAADLVGQLADWASPAG
ncbi:MAG TPA: aromatic amino acid lyase [Dermatophilaceae bacterium]|nr:aromatic amino acid lyase [Dermatophilaceae bacterium]